MTTMDQTDLERSPEDAQNYLVEACPRFARRYRSFFTEGGPYTQLEGVEATTEARCKAWADQEAIWMSLYDEGRQIADVRAITEEARAAKLKATEELEDMQIADDPEQTNILTLLRASCMRDVPLGLIAPPKGTWPLSSHWWPALFNRRNRPRETVDA